ncbi:hypothetical protein MXB_592 [Myxobolus squamalis]|nr:hypothetical protein MXB_592 [Myxobolus squamalis]
MEVLGPRKAHSDFNPAIRSVIGIAGENFAFLASDNRMSEGYMIHSRNIPKVTRLSKNLYIGICGFHGDVTAFLKIIEIKIKDYQTTHKKVISACAAAQLISNTLYYRRFFPYYTYIILAGIDENNHGAVFNYDPVGSYERVKCHSAGSGSAVIQPILDSQVALLNQENPKPILDDPEKVAMLIHDAFCSASERDIYTGDGGTIVMISPFDENVKSFDLRHD